jgi:hypothetical protein
MGAGVTAPGGLSGRRGGRNNSSRQHFRGGGPTATWYMSMGDERGGEMTATGFDARVYKETTKRG